MFVFLFQGISNENWLTAGFSVTYAIESVEEVKNKFPGFYPGISLGWSTFENNKNLGFHLLINPFFYNGFEEKTSPFEVSLNTLVAPVYKIGNKTSFFLSAGLSAGFLFHTESEYQEKKSLTYNRWYIGVGGDCDIVFTNKFTIGFTFNYYPFCYTQIDKGYDMEKKKLKNWSSLTAIGICLGFTV